jgi:hypothetical protein
MPVISEKCISSWKQYFPDYEIKKWNETSYDVHKIPYTDEAYQAKKYAFVSDYARFDILYNYGGIYFDADVEVIRPFDNILECGGFMGFEDSGMVNAGLCVGCEARLNIINQIIEFYATIHFLNDDGTYNLHTVVEYITSILKKNGLRMENIFQKLDDINIYPADFFSPRSIITGKLNITENTRSIHHYVASWIPENDKYFYAIKRCLCRIWGRNFGTLLSSPLFFFMNIKNYGIRIGLKKILRRIHINKI